MKIGYGHGYNEIILDFQRGLLSYPPDVKAEDLGGHEYYTSRSGASGDANVPWSINWAVVEGYRTDVSFLKLSRPEDETIPGFRIVAPYLYHKGIDHDYPVVVWRGNDPRPIFMHTSGLLPFLQGKIEAGERTLEWEPFYVRRNGETTVVADYSCRILETNPHEFSDHIRKLMILLDPNLQFITEEEERKNLPEFFSRHGWTAFKSDDDWNLPFFYRVDRYGHCRTGTDGFEEALNVMQTWPHIRFIHNRCYIGKSNGGYYVSYIDRRFQSSYTGPIDEQQVYRILNRRLNDFQS